LIKLCKNSVNLNIHKLEVVKLKTYKLTVFEANGEKLLDESFQATNDTEAKTKGEQLLQEKNFLEKTHRCVSPTGKLVLFHV
jgi:hypothetical protein